MATWSEITDSEPEFAARVRELFDAHKHKTIATLRKDGSPRISGIEADFVAGDLWFGSMPNALKARDLQRDPRFALHSASVIDDDGDPSSWPGDAKLAGNAIEVTDHDEIKAMFTERGIDTDSHSGSHFFKADIQEIVITRVGTPADHLLIEHWTPNKGLNTIKRAD